MSLLKNKVSKIFDIKQKEFIDNIKLPSKLSIVTDSMFDSEFIFTEDDLWVISVGGEHFSFYFSNFDIYSKKLFKYLIIIINQRNCFIWSLLLKFMKIF